MYHKTSSTDSRWPKIMLPPGVIMRAFRSPLFWPYLPLFIMSSTCSWCPNNWGQNNYSHSKLIETVCAIIHGKPHLTICIKQILLWSAGGNLLATISSNKFYTNHGQAAFENRGPFLWNRPWSFIRRCDNKKILKTHLFKSSFPSVLVCLSSSTINKI